jgi:hypothetical protein
MDDSVRVALEHMVDRVGVCGVLDALLDMCGHKAEHLRSNWQDEASAKDWESVGVVLGKCLGRLSKLA